MASIKNASIMQFSLRLFRYNAFPLWRKEGKAIFMIIPFLNAIIMRNYIHFFPPPGKSASSPPSTCYTLHISIETPCCLLSLRVDEWLRLTSWNKTDNLRPITTLISPQWNQWALSLVQLAWRQDVRSRSLVGLTWRQESQGAWLAAGCDVEVGELAQVERRRSTLQGVPNSCQNERLPSVFLWIFMNALSRHDFGIRHSPLVYILKRHSQHSSRRI